MRPRPKYHLLISIATCACGDVICILNVVEAPSATQGCRGEGNNDGSLYFKFVIYFRILEVDIRLGGVAKVLQSC